MPFAARLTDNHLCPAVTGIVPHVGGPILPPCSLNVRTNSLFQARATDKATCVGPPDTIVVGSATVKVNGLMAARLLDQCMHGGTIGPVTSLNVNIGGPSAGATIGNPAAATAACTALANGRTSHSVSQTNNNCGVESSRLIINQATGANRSEDGLLDESMEEGDADEERSRTASGGTSPAGREGILERNGVRTTNVPGTMNNITQAVSEGRGVITSHEVSILWGNGQTGGHAINVIGLQYDANGNLLNVIMADTGLGNCSRSIPAAQFQQSLRPGRDANVTDNPVW